MATHELSYPATLDIPYPDRELDRLSSFFRPLFAIPILVILSLVTGPTWHATTRSESFEAGGLVALATALMIVFRQKYPRWWFDWNLALTRFGVRVWAYLALLGDAYPSTDEEQGVFVDLEYPDAREDLNRWLPLVKWFLAIPHFIVLGVLCCFAVAAVIIAWFAILFRGRYPRSLHEFVVGVFRWWLRVAAYAVLLTTDRYPPFRLA